MPSEFLRLKAGMPALGVGIGLRGEICEQIVAHRNAVDFLEFTPENYRENNATIGWLSGFAELFPLVSHSVTLSIGSIDPLDPALLKTTRFFLKKFKLHWWSDHLCFSGVDGESGNDLFPLPWTEETVKHVARKVKQAQETVEYPLILENIPYYTKMPAGDFDEAEFIARTLEESDCGMLLDINNLFVNSINHKFDPRAFLDKLPLERVVQIHLAGPGRFGKRIIDTHGSSVPDPVFEILDYVLSKNISPKAVMIERDQYFPDFAELLTELNHAREIWNKHCKPKESLAAVTEKSEQAIELHTDFAPPPVVGELAALPAGDGRAPEEVAEPVSERGKESSAAGVDPAMHFTDLAQYERRWFGLWTDLIGTDPEAVDSDTFEAHYARKPVATDGFDIKALSIYTWLRDSNRDSLMRNVFPACYKLLRNSWKEVLQAYFYDFRVQYKDNSTVGDRFPEFLRSYYRSFLTFFPYIFELAEFEQLKYAAGRTHQYTDFSGDVYLGSTEQIKKCKPFVNPELTVQSFIYPVQNIEAAVKDDEQYDSQALEHPQILAFLPQSWSSKIVHLSAAGMRMLDAARAGHSSYSQLIAAGMSEEERKSPEAIARQIKMFQILHDQKIFIGSVPADYNVGWASYCKAVADQPPHLTVLTAMKRFEEGNEPAGQAVDLGCGAGRDSRALLSKGWKVFAVDSSKDALEILQQSANGWSEEQLSIFEGKMEEAPLPSADLINAGISLPFCSPEKFPILWSNVCRALKSGGRFSGHFFGKNDDWAVNKKMSFFSSAELKEMFKDFEIEWFQEMEGPVPIVPTGFRHGQIFEVVARKL